jgi:short-subunit dehydrogenase
MELGLNGKTVVVTGGSKGIGKDVARGFHSEGCTVRHVSRSPENLEAAAAEIGGEDRSRVFLHAKDISRSQSVGELLAAVGTPDILVNNTGTVGAGHGANQSSIS